MLINYAAFLIAIKYVDSKYAFWTWVLVSPLTYETWRYVEKLKTW